MLVLLAEDVSANHVYVALITAVATIVGAFLSAMVTVITVIYNARANRKELQKNTAATEMAVAISTVAAENTAIIGKDVKETKTAVTGEKPLPPDLTPRASTIRTLGEIRGIINSDSDKDPFAKARKEEEARRKSSAGGSKHDDSKWGSSKEGK